MCSLIAPPSLQAEDAATAVEVFAALFTGEDDGTEQQHQRQVACIEGGGAEDGMAERGEGDGCQQGQFAGDADQDQGVAEECRSAFGGC